MPGFFRYLEPGLSGFGRRRATAATLHFKSLELRISIFGRKIVVFFQLSHELLAFCWVESEISGRKFAPRIFDLGVQLGYVSIRISLIRPFQ